MWIRREYVFLTYIWKNGWGIYGKDTAGEEKVMDAGGTSKDAVAYYNLRPCAPTLPHKPTDRFPIA